jgi:hypothetical protein
VGKVEFRQGEGTLFAIPLGQVAIETTWADATFSWGDASFHQAAAIPLEDFLDYVIEGAVRLGR